TTPCLFHTIFLSFLFTHPAPPVLYTLSLHDALPIYSAKHLVKHSIVQSFFVLEVVIDQCLIYPCQACDCVGAGPGNDAIARLARSEEHTSELQSRENLVCRLLLEKKKK